MGAFDHPHAGSPAPKRASLASWGWGLVVLGLHGPFLVDVPVWPFALGSALLALVIRRRPIGAVLAVSACYWAGVSAMIWLAEQVPWVPFGYPWYSLVPLLFMLAWMRLSGRERLVWRGRMTGWVGPGSATALGLVAAAVLYVWLGRHPETHALVSSLLPAWPTLGLIGLALAFAVFNAWLEETMYRGCYQQALIPAIGIGPAILIQGTLFGALHVIGGVPSGALGGVLAGLFGIAMGWLAHRSGGLRLPILAHAIADLAIMLTVILGPGR